MPDASPLSSRAIISLNIGLPGILAVLVSMKVSAIKIFSFWAKLFSSSSWEGIDNCCLSSSSVDFLA
ncbi:MAG: hypothetical protein AAB441_02905 [Patescibacteria group bacterium]